MKRGFGILFLSLLLPVQLFSLSFEPNGESDRYYDLLNPGQTASGAGVLQSGSLTDTFVNPAVQAFRQRFAFDVNYAGIVGRTGERENGYPGHALTFGAGLPSPVGYFTLTGGYFHSSWNEYALGNQGFFNVALGKKVYEELYLGLGLKTVFGGLEENPLDWLVAADLGVVHKPGRVGDVADFQWGLALQNLGWGTLSPFSADQNNKGMIAPDLFSVQAGLSFSAFKTDRFRLGFESEIFLPSMMNFEVGAGFLFEFERIFAFSVSSRLNALQLRDGDYSDLLPSFGFVVRYIPKASDAVKAQELTEAHFKASSGAVDGLNLWTYQAGATVFLGGEDTYAPDIRFNVENDDPETDAFFEIDTEAAVSVGEISLRGDNRFDLIRNDAATEGTFHKTPPAHRILIAAGGEKENSLTPVAEDSPDKEIQPPPFSDNPQPSYFISPNFDGIRDSLKVKLDIRDTQLVQSYRFVVEDSTGEPVRVLQNKEQRAENRSLDFFRNLFRPYKGIYIPSEIEWDGTSDSGEIVPDGLYSFYLTATDENGNTAVTDRVYFVVDTVYPEVSFEYEADDLIFSPNRDGNKDFLDIGQVSSEEVLWKTQIENDFIGVVDRKNYEGRLPKRLVWGGGNQSGIPVPDGTYRYRAEAVDRAGNRTEAFLDGIVLNTEQTPVQLFVDAAAFSPKSESGLSFLTFTPDLTVKDDIIEWSVRIVNEADETVKELTGTGTDILGGFVFDGLQENGEPFPDGVYTARLDVVYRNGNRPRSVTPQFRIDTASPSAAVEIPDAIFSPDEDGQKDRLEIVQTGTEEDEWTAEITDQDGRTVFSQKWYGKLPETFVFDGYGSDNQVLPDGEYVYKLSAVDAAGNAGESRAVAFTVDTKKSAVELKTDYAAFSPNGDGIKESVELIPEIENSGSLESFELTVINADDRVVRSFPNDGYIQPRYRFDGKGDDGTVLPDGLYRFRLNAVFENGQKAERLSRAVLLKTTYPKADLEYDNLWFSPDGDGLRDVLTWKQSSSSESLWSGVIKDQNGRIVRNFKTSGTLTDFEWDGKNNQGNLLPNGVYSYELESVDEAGNRFFAEVKEIHLDKTPTLVSVSASSKGISPNGDGRLDAMTLKPTVSYKTGIESWRILIQGEKGQKTYSGDGTTLPDSLVWDGKTDDGQIAEGNYRLTFAVDYLKGNRPEAVIESLVVDVTPPVLNVDLSPLPFSPDNDNVNDELSIHIAFDDASEIAKWQFAIFDPKNNPFKSFAGRGKRVDAIRWDGRSGKGDTVFSAEDYPYRFMAADEWGNYSEISGVIPVDILVVKDGDHLKIQIANIIFAANSPSLESSDPESAAKNRAVLNRLAQTLKKYKSYQVQVEGHANAVLWYDEARAQREEAEALYPLSLARAQTIVNELVKVGIEPSRLSAVGRGGKFPIVDPKKDAELWKRENWKNRRVEFILEK